MKKPSLSNKTADLAWWLQPASPIKPDAPGLTSIEARARLRKFGPNLL